MGFLAMKDLGAVGIKTSSGFFEVDNSSTHGALNPSGSNYPESEQCINLSAYSLNYSTGKDVDDSSNIAGNVTRLGIGGATSIPITLNARFSRKRISEESSSTGGTQYTRANANTLSYLTAWCRRRTMGLLFWMPNADILADNTGLSFGQDKDFFTSLLRSMYDVLWDKNLSNATTGWHDSTYGTFHYKFTNFFTNNDDYEPCAIPVVLNEITVKNEAISNMIDVSISGYVITNEEDQSN